MTPMGDSTPDRRLRAPGGHGQIFADPPLNEVAYVLDTNVQLFKPCDVDLRGRALTDLRREATADLLEQAIAYTRAYRDVRLPTDGPSRPILLTGHQPQLFHAGVWFKTFALDAVAKQRDAWAVNLLIDNDILSTPSIRVPGGTIDRPRLASVAFDAPAEPVPYEVREIRDAELFEPFGNRVASTIEPFIADPLIRKLWPLAVEASQDTRNVGRVLAQARHRLEGQWGLNSVELPLSRVCRTRAFQWFALSLLLETERFRDIHNLALAEYRRINRVRSRSHPVPDLVEDTDGWQEAPFWIWTAERPRRQRLFGRAHGTELRITDRGRIDETLSSEIPRAVDQIAELAERGITIRPRALITTMYARLVLSHLFLHGIGGAKYDELTNAIIEQFFGITPPGFLTLTATCRLPIARPQVSEREMHEIKRDLRHVEFHPERFLAAGDRVANPKVRELVEEKRRWIAAGWPSGQRAQRHREITRINVALQPFVAARLAELRQRRKWLSQHLDAERILASREFSYCLFPEKTLRPLLLELSAVAS